MTPLAQPTGLMRALGELQWVTDAQIQEALAHPEEGPFGALLALIRRANLAERAVAQLAGERFGVPVLDLAAVDLNVLPKGLIDADLAYRHGVLPLAQRKGKVEVAVADPSQVELLDAVRFQGGRPVEAIAVPAETLWQTLSTLNRSVNESLAALTPDDLFDFSAEIVAEAETPPPVVTEVEDAPVVKFIHKILFDAINEGASDIHFEPFEKHYRIRYRTDGELREVSRPPVAIKDKIAARIKIMARLDISERRLPQDGRIKLVLNQQKAIDFRVSTLPTLWGEKIVMRLLDPAAAMLGIDALGYEPEQKEALLAAIHRPYGMILVTGPTGSGKTVTLYTCLGLLNQPNVNISTAEDPVEINLPGINQVQINEKTGLTFAAALRAFLRQDPDIIMVGEIRDLETAEIAVKAAQTGHLVLSTLHTNNAPSTLDRLRLMGVAPFNIASSVILITAQRLVRRLCTCKIPAEHTPAELLAAGFTESDLDEKWVAYLPRPGGCSRCHGSGYKGRVALHEVLPITDALRALIVANANALELEAQARRDGVINLRRAGLLKVKAGITSLAEVIAATND
ncbi:MAG: type IV-A pilus assembly ATPase PilB [Hydrogenophilus sp.]|nr:type IV-A pilus assembly ATPase PilB [Hydrogenophilus sp.]